ALALLHPHCAVAAPAQATTALCRWQPPCQGAANLATGDAAPAGVPAGGCPFRVAAPTGSHPLEGAWPWPATSSCRQYACGRPSPAGSSYFHCQSL
ncbi:hypothetical protein BHE74_00057790, partial [Ensete ventricosum]